MPANILTDYGLKDLEKSLIPSRSRLYHLEPIGIGTPFVESLTSYITRLAHAHCVEPRILVIREILPYLKKLGWLGSKHQRLLAINGIGSLANQWVQAVEELTLRRNLRFLTMLTWSNVIDFHAVVHNTRAWCPSCYEEALQTGQIIYDPLIWSLRGVTRCPRHHQRLCYCCPNQNCQSTLPYFTNGPRPGYCPYCESCLGLVPQEVDLGAELDSEDELKKLLWQEHAVSELIEAAPNLAVLPEREAVGFGITSYLAQAMTGSLASLAGKLGVYHIMLLGWQSGQHLPQFSMLLQLCYRMDVSPLSFLIRQASESNAFPFQVRTDSPLKVGEKGHKAVDIQLVRQQLEAILADEESCPLSLKKIAARVKCPVPILRYYFPQLCNAIAERYQKLLDVDRQRQALEAALARDENSLPSVKEIARCLGCSAKMLRYRFPEECRVIAEKRRKTIDIESLRLALEKVLVSQEVPFPTEEEIARRLGCGHSTLRKHFPALCREMAKKRQEMAKSKELQGVRVEKRRRKLDIDSSRQTLQEIVQGHESTPPTIIEVARRLGCSDNTLRRHFPDLCHEIAKRSQKRCDYDSLQRSLNAALLSDERPPSLRELAQRLDCSAWTLSVHFPELCAQITERHRGWGDADEQRRVLEAALTSEAASSLSVNDIARLLGSSSSTLFKRFPELCGEITKRRWKLSDTEDLRQELEAALVNDEQPPPLGAIAKQFGCHTQSLKYYFPELCAAIVRRRREPSSVDSVSYLQQVLEEILEGDEDPVSMLEVARRLGRSPEFFRDHFPEQCRAISARYTAHRKSRSQARISSICDEVKQATFLIHSRGEYPSQRLVIPLLRYPTILWRPEFRRAWHEALRELGYD